MTTLDALFAAFIMLITGVVVFQYGTGVRGGAGAPGSIIMLIGVIIVIGSIFGFGVSFGLHLGGK